MLSAERGMGRPQADGDAVAADGAGGSKLALDTQSHSMTQANTLYPPM